MRIKNIFTKRTYEHASFWDLVYEWEDVLCHELGASLKNESKVFDKKLKGIPFAYSLETKGQPSLCFQMGSEIVPKNLRFLQCIFGLRAKNISHVVPCIIDFWETEDDLAAFRSAYSHNKVVLVSSIEACAFLRAHGCASNVAHWPLSLPDKYAIKPDTKFVKQYDLALMGRQNPLLEEFLNTYIKLHPNFVYAYKKKEDGHFNYYTNKGVFVGNADSREGYFNIMHGAKVGLYATPGLDNKDGANGYNQITPRFLELISSGCHIIARYKNNEEAKFWEIDKFSPSIETYDDFEKCLDSALAKPVDMDFYSSYLSRHYTSIRAKQLKEILKTI